MKWTKISDELAMRAVRTADGITPATAMWEVHRRGPRTYVLLQSLLVAPGPVYVAASLASTRTRYPRRAKVFAKTKRRDGCYRAARRLETPKVEKKPEVAEPLPFLDRACLVLAELPRAQVLAAHDALWPGEVRSARKTRRVKSEHMRLRLAMALQSSVDAGRHWEGECVLEEPLAALFIEARKQTPKAVKNWKAVGASPPPVIKRILSDADLAFRSAVERTGCSG